MNQEVGRSSGSGIKALNKVNLKNALVILNKYRVSK